MVPEIWSVTDNFLSFWTVFCPFTPLWPRKSRFFKNEKSTWRYYHFTNVHHKWQSYDVWFLGIWSMTDRFFLSFWTDFCPFTLLTIRKIKILKNWNKHTEILSFYTYVPWMKFIWCMVLEILSVTDRFFVTLDHFLPLYLPKNLKNQNFEKLKKMSGGIIILHMCVINDNHMMYGS